VCAIAIACGHRATPHPPAAGHLHVRTTDGPGGPPIAARVLFFLGDEPIHFGKKELYDGKRQATGSCMLADGALGTWDGLVLAYGDAVVPVGGGDPCEPSPALPLGTFKVWAWRGVEYERWEGTVTVGDGANVELTIPLQRAWTPRGALAADLHVHAQASNDSGVPFPVRVMTEMAAGTQVIGLSDHNVSGDLADAIASLHASDRVVSIPSNELGNDRMHEGVYPVTVDKHAARGGSPSADDVKDWSPAKMMAWGHAQPGHPIVQINHPRFRVYSLFDSTGWDGVQWPPPFPLDFDAVEVLAGYTAFNAPKDRRIDEGVRDFYTLVGHGALVAGVGNSDTHHLNGVHDALARTYVFSDDPRVAPFDRDAFVSAIRAGARSRRPGRGSTSRWSRRARARRRGRVRRSARRAGTSSSTSSSIRPRGVTRARSACGSARPTAPARSRRRSRSPARRRACRCRSRSARRTRGSASTPAATTRCRSR
jgi:hypothetical protein